MGLLMICPHCHTKLPLACRTCLGCGADLRDLPTSARRYFIGEPDDPSLSAPEPSSEPLHDTRELEVVKNFPEPDAPEFSSISGPFEASIVEPQPRAPLPKAPSLEHQDVSLCEALDRILNKGAVLFGEVMISVADIDLVYLGLQVILASMETARGLKPAFGEGQGPNIFAKGVY